MSNKNICSECIGNTYLQSQIEENNHEGYHYCKETLPCIHLEELVSAVKETSDQHYALTFRTWTLVVCLHDKVWWRWIGTEKAWIYQISTIGELYRARNLALRHMFRIRRQRNMGNPGIWRRYDDDPHFVIGVVIRIGKIVAWPGAVHQKRESFQSKLREHSMKYLPGLDNLKARLANSRLSLQAGPQSEHIQSLFKELASTAVQFIERLRSPETELGPPQ